jgi:quercetin dioxygenase-like cupin family protein
MSQTHTVFLNPSQGDSFNIIGGGVRILIDGNSSNGQLCMFEAPIPPGEGPPLHSHVREDEMFYILRGKFKFSVACAPRGSIHAFRNISDSTALMLVTCTPAGIEGPFRAVRMPAPNSGIEPLSIEAMVEIFSRHGVTFHGPPLGAD